MACKVRVGSEEPDIRIGLPETKLGVVPGWGGTVRLPAIVGLKIALPMICFGELIGPQKALDVGLLDEIGPNDGLNSMAIARGRRSPPKRRVPITTLSEHQMVLADVEARVREKCPKDQIPASLAVLRIMQGAQAHGHQAHFELERKMLVELRHSRGTERLLQAFFDRQAAKKR
jgi:3-hydroxyacyl-CoA dehydrogenase/enoyl-CoA hydratase/3-hydroxybutyryl-CoA epimerase